MGTADGRKVTIDPSEKKVTELFEVIHNESRVIDLQALGIFPTDKARAGQGEGGGAREERQGSVHEEHLRGRALPSTQCCVSGVGTP